MPTEIARVEILLHKHLNAIYIQPRVLKKKEMHPTVRPYDHKRKVREQPKPITVQSIGSSADAAK